MTIKFSSNGLKYQSEMSNRTLTLKLQTFSLKYNIKQKSDENKEKFKLRDYYLMLYQILQTNFIRIVRQTEN